MDTAQEAPETVIVAGDEASLYLQATLQVVWAPKGETPVVKVDPGRENLHFYAALNLQTGQEIVMRTRVMKAVTSVLFLLKLVAAYPNQRILLLWDRAPWHHGPAIRDFLATQANLEIFYFPPASPDLNPQEHVWKDARDHISHNHTIHKLAELADKFEDHLTSNTFPCPLLEQHAYPQICAMFT
jgi:transposase